MHDPTNVFRLSGEAFVSAAALIEESCLRIQSHEDLMRQKVNYVPSVTYIQWVHNYELNIYL